MAPREVIGIGVAVLGTLLVPFGLFHDPQWWIAVVLLIFLGFALLYTKRVEEFEKEHGPAPGPSRGFGLHTDQIQHKPPTLRGSDTSDHTDGADGD